MKPVALATCAAVIALAALPAWAQKKVYRCTEGGRTVYSDAPCKEAVEVKADDARSDAQRRDAREAVRSEAKAADQMAKERRANEAAVARQGAAHIPYSAAQQAAAPPPAASAGQNTSPKKPKAPKAPPAQP